MNELIQKTVEQLYLVVISTGLATIIGTLLGLFLARFSFLSKFTLSVANIIQTIPSLALLALFLPLFGIGVKTALVALTLYGVLPILKNTLFGVRSIAPSITEAGNSMHFNAWQRLSYVELPLAFPMIITGIRIAAVINVGTATLAAFVGAGGLGDFINRGLALNNNTLLLMGAIPAALLAIAVDAFLALLETIFKVPVIPLKWWNTRLFKRTFLIVLFLSLLSFGILYHYPSTNKIKVATKNFTEQIILGEIIAQLIEATTPYQVERKFHLGSTAVCQEALLKNEIDLYPEYTGTAYFTVLKEKKQLPSKDLFEFVKKEYQKKFKINWLPPLGFNNTQALAVLKRDPRFLNINNISALVPFANKLSLGAPSEIFGRPDGLELLKRGYGINFLTIREMESSLMYRAITNHQVDVVAIFSTDGKIKAFDLKVLKDNLHVFPTYEACIVVNEIALIQFPLLKTTLQLLSGKITQKIMQEMNEAVDVRQESVAQVATNFLKTLKT